MKNLFLLLGMAMMATGLLAVPAKPGLWRTITLVDGTTVQAELQGDEFGSWFCDREGRCYKQLTEQSADEVMLYAETTREAMVERSKQNRRAAAEQETAAQGESFNNRIKNFKGEKRCLVVLLQFTDVKFSFDKSLFQKFINGIDAVDETYGLVGSVRDWFRAQSYNQFDINFDVVGPYTLSHGYAYYGGNSGNSNNARMGEFVNEGFNLADPYVNYANYDWDGDGVVEQIFFIYAGQGEASGGNENTIWPHKSAVQYVRKDNAWLSTYACACELQEGGETRADLSESAVPSVNGIGTMCHEFSHCLGLRDSYDAGSSGNKGMTFWSPMCSGNYMGNSFHPCCHTAFERMSCGWVTPQELTVDTEVSGMKALADAPEAYIIYNPANKNEFYMLENRQRKGFDDKLYGAGMLITHIDYDKDLWDYNRINSFEYSNDHERFVYVPADNQRGYSTAADLAGDVWPRGTTNRISFNTKPALELYTAYKGKKVLYKEVKNIALKNGLISFSFVDRSDAMEPDTHAPAGAIFYESFNQCEGEGGNDNQFGSTSVGTFAPDHVWSGVNVYAGLQCARYGTNTQKGITTSPEIDLGNEVVLYALSFKSAPYTGDKNTGLTVAVASGDAIVADTTGILDSAVREAFSQKSVALKYATQTAWNDYTIFVYGSGKVKLRFTSAVKRMWLDEVAILPSDLDLTVGIEQISSASAPVTSACYNLLGRQVSADYKGIVVSGGKKIISY